MSCTVYLTDIRHREPVYRVLGRRLKGVYPVFTGLAVSALARPEWLVEVATAAAATVSMREGTYAGRRPAGRPGRGKRRQDPKER